LNKCLQSILNNDTNFAFEILIVDDGSTQNISDILYSLKATNIKYFKKKNEGLSKAISFGIKKTKFNYISKIDPDDTVNKDYINIICNKIISEKKLIYYFNYIIIDKKRTLYIDQKKVFYNLNYPIGSTLVINKKVFDTIGNYGSNFYHMDDFATWLKIKKKIHHSQISKIPNYLYNYYKHGENMSDKLIKKNLTKYFIYFVLLFSK
jgi:hypothetical protein